jgi:hypothetical protein
VHPVFGGGWPPLSAESGQSRRMKVLCNLCPDEVLYSGAACTAFFNFAFLVDVKLCHLNARGDICHPENPASEYRSSIFEQWKHETAVGFARVAEPTAHSYWQSMTGVESFGRQSWRLERDGATGCSVSRNHHKENQLSAQGARPDLCFHESACRARLTPTSQSSFQEKGRGVSLDS